MRRLSLTLPAALLLALPAVAQESLHDPIPWANKFFTGKTDAAPPVILKDFGALPKGTVRTYQFQMTNIYAVTMHLREPRASCGCVSVKEYTGAMKPRETGHILIEVNTGNFDGFKSVKLPVTFEGRDPRSGEPFFSTAQLEVRVVSQRDITFEPGAVAFGVVPAGKRATQVVTVVYTGRQPGWEVTGVEYKKELLDVDFTRVQVRGARTAFQVRAAVKETAPAGRVDDTIVLKTNDPTAPALTLSVTGVVQAPLTVFGPDKDGLLRIGKVEIGKTEKRIVTVQADKKIKITKVEGQGDGVTAFVAPVDANKSQSLTISFAPANAGPVKKTLTIKTDTGDSVTMTVDAVGVDPQ